MEDFDFDFDDDLFSDDSSDKFKTQYAKIKRYNRPKVVKYEYAKDMAAQIGKVKENEHIFALVSGNFIAGDFIEAYLEENDLFAEEIIIATLSLSKENVDSLKNILEWKRCGRMGLLVSDYFFAHERKDGIEYIIETLNYDGFLLAAAAIHTKITLIKTFCGMNLVIGGSANLRSSRNIEQITIDNSKELYEFNREWIVGLLKKYQATHKSLRGGALWQQVAVEVAKVDIKAEPQKAQLKKD